MFINRNTSLTVHSHFYICRSLPDFSSGPLSDTTHSRQVPEEQTVFKKKIHSSPTCFRTTDTDLQLHGYVLITHKNIVNLI